MKKAQVFKIGKNPVVVLPIETWEKISDRVNMLEEHYQMSNSKKYKKDITDARVSKNEITASPNPLRFAETLHNFDFGTYRFRVDDYRIIFDVENNVAKILKVGHRKDIYK